jgi:hypothetical protein
MTKNRIQYGKSSEIPVWFNELKPGECTAKFLASRKERCWPSLGQTCCMTGEVIKAEDGVYLVWCNSTLFPNAIVSKKAVDAIGYMEATALLKKSWTDAQKFMAWFV